MSSSFKRRGKKPASIIRPAFAAAADQPQPSSSSSSAPSNEPNRTSAVTQSSSSKITSPSSHRVKSLSSSLLPGTKPWTNNLTLTSFGLREIDSFFFSSGGGSDGGGGQPLQTLVMLEEDRLADDLARALCRYWCAEGVAQRQVVLLGSLLPGVELSLRLLDDDDDGCVVGVGGHYDNYEGSTPEELADFVSSLPRNLHLEKFRASAKKKQSSTASTIGNGDGQVTNNNNREAISAIIEEEEEEDDDNGDDDGNTEAQPSKDEGLINAWQYRKSVQDARSGMGSSDGASQSSSDTAGGDGIYCHSYDLSKRMWDQYASDNQDADENPLVTNTNVIDCSRALSSPKILNNAGNMAVEYQRQGMALFCCLWKHLQTTLSTHPNTVIRLFLHRLPVGQGSIAMPLLMSKIRKENLPVVVLTTIRPWKWLSSTSSSSSNDNNNNKLDTLASLRSATDTILSLDSFSSLRTPPPPEFSLLQGILTVRKCSSFTVSHYTDTVTWKRPLAERFGVKRDGRKVTVQLLHLPPEEYSKGGSSTGGVRSGGGNTVDKKEQHQHGNGSSGAAGGCSSVGGGASLDF